MYVCVCNADSLYGLMHLCEKILLEEHRRVLSSIANMHLGNEIASAAIFERATIQVQQDLDGSTLPDTSFLSDASFSIDAFEDEYKTWTSVYDYATMRQYSQVGMIVLDQSSLLSFLNLQAREGLMANVQALPRCYEYFLRVMINILRPIMEHITIVATTIEEGRVWVARASQLLSSHPWRKLFDSHCMKLKLFREVISRRACDDHDSSLLDDSDQVDLRRCEVEWESLFEAFLSCLKRVQERDCDQRRILDNLLDTTEQSITSKTQALRREFCQELSILKGAEHLDEIGTIQPRNSGSPQLLIQKIRSVVDLESEKMMLQEHLLKLNTLGSFSQKEARRECTKKSLITLGTKEIEGQMSDEIAGFEKLSPSRTLLDQALFVLDIRNHLKKWFSCVMTWNETYILNLDPDAVSSQLSQFRCWVSVSLHHIHALKWEDDEALADSEKIIQIPLDTELYSLNIVQGQIHEMEENLSIITALKSKSFDEDKWRMLPWESICVLLTHENSQQQYGDPARTLREFLTLQTLQTLWKQHKESSTPENTTGVEGFAIHTKQSLLDLSRDVNESDALGQRVANLASKLDTILIRIVPTNLLPEESAAGEGKGLTTFVATSYHIDGLRKASIALQEICMELRVCRQFNRGYFLSLIQDTYTNVQNRIRLCHNIENFQKNWLSIAEASKLYEIDEFTCKKDQESLHTSIMGRHVSKRNFESDWKSICKTWTLWNDCLRDLYLAKESPNQLTRVPSNKDKVGIISSHYTSQSAQKIASNLKKSTDVKSNLSKKHVQRKWRRIDDVWNAFAKFDWEQHVQYCEKALFILDVYLTTCVREKVPRLYCLSNQELLHLMLIADHEVHESADTSTSSIILNSVFAKCFSPGLHFEVCDAQSGAMRPDTEWKADEEYSHATSSFISTIRGVSLSSLDQRVSRKRTGMLFFSAPIVLVGRLAFWWVRLEGEMYKVVHDNVWLLIDQFTSYLEELENSEVDELSSHSVEKEMIVSSWITRQEKITKRPILPQSIVTALMSYFTRKLDITLSSLSASTSSENNKAQSLSHVTEIQSRIMENLVDCYRDSTTQMRVKVHIDNLLLVCIYHRELITILVQASRDGRSPELIWKLQLRLLTESKVTEHLQLLKDSASSTSSHRSMYNTVSNAMHYLRPNDQRAELKSKSKHQKSSLGLIASVGDISIPFGHEMIGNYKLSFLTPCTERCLFALWMALRFQNLASFTSSPDSDKSSIADGSTYVNDIGMLLMRWCVRYTVSNHVQSSGSLNLHTRTNLLCRLLHAIVALDGFLLIDAREDLKHIKQEMFREIRCQIEKFRVLATQISHEGSPNVTSTAAQMQSTPGIWIFTSPAQFKRKNLFKSIDTNFQTFSIISPPIELIVTSLLIRSGSDLQDVYDTRIPMFLNELLDYEQDPERLSTLASVFGLALTSSMHIIRHIFSAINDLKKSAKILYFPSKDESAQRRMTRVSMTAKDINRDGNVDRDAWILAQQAMIHHVLESSMHRRLNFLHSASSTMHHRITMLLKLLTYLQQKYLPVTAQCRVYEFAKRFAKLAEPIPEALRIAAYHMQKDCNEQITNVCLDSWKSMQSQMDLRHAARDRTSNSQMAVPLGIIVYGDPACGKTTMIKILHHAICALEEIDDSDDRYIDFEGRDVRTVRPAELATINPHLLGALDLLGEFAKDTSLHETGVDTARFGLLGRMLNLKKRHNDDLGSEDSIVRRRWIHVDANEALSSAWIEDFVTFTSHYYRSISDTFGSVQRNWSFIFETIDLSAASPSFLWIVFRPVYVESSLYSYQGLIERWKTTWRHRQDSSLQIDEDPISSPAAQLLSHAFQLVEVILTDVCNSYTQSSFDCSGSESISTFGGISFNYLTIHTLDVLDYILSNLLEQLREQAKAEPSIKSNGTKSSFLLSSRYNLSRAIRLCCFGMIWCVSGHLEEINRRKFELLVRQKLGNISRDKIFAVISESEMSLYASEEFFRSSSSPKQYKQKVETIYYLPARDAFTNLFDFAQLLLSTGRGSFLLFGPRGCGKSSLLRRLMQEISKKLEEERDLEVPMKARQTRSILDMNDRGRLVVDFSTEDHEAAIDDMPRHVNELPSAYDYVFIDNLSLLEEHQKQFNYHQQNIMSTAQYEWIRTILDHQLCYHHPTRKMEHCRKQFGGALSTTEERDWKPQLTQRFIRHFTLLRVPPLLKHETMSIFRGKFREVFDIPLETPAPVEVICRPFLSIEEAILRSTVDFIDEFTKVTGHWRIYCTEAAGNYIQSLPVLLHINSHHINEILSRTLRSHREAVSDQTKKNENITFDPQHEKNHDATRLRQLGYAHQVWLTEIFQTGYDTWSKVMDTMSKSLLAKQSSRSLSILEMLHKDQEAVRQALRLTSEKYFSMSLSAVQGWSSDGGKATSGGNISPLQQQEMMSFLHHILQWYRLNPQRTTNQLIGKNLSDWYRRVCQVAMNSTNRYALENGDKTYSLPGHIASESTQWSILRHEILKKCLSNANQSMKSPKMVQGMSEIHSLSTGEINMWLSTDWWQYRLLQFTAALLSGKHLFVLHIRNERSTKNNLLQPTIWSLVSMSTRLGCYSHAYQVHIDLLRLKDLIKILTMTGVYDLRVILWIRDSLNDDDDDAEAHWNHNEMSTVVLLLKDILCNQVMAPQSWILEQTNPEINDQGTTNNAANAGTDQKIDHIQDTWNYIYDEVLQTKKKSLKVLTERSFREKVMKNLHVCIVDQVDDNEPYRESLKSHKKLKPSRCIKDFVDLPSVRWVVIREETIDSKSPFFSQIVRGCITMFGECIENAISHLATSKVINQQRYTTHERLYEFIIDNHNFWNGMKGSPLTFTRFLKNWVCACAKNVACKKLKLIREHRYHTALRNFDTLMSKLTARRQLLETELVSQIQVVTKHIERDLCTLKASCAVSINNAIANGATTRDIADEDIFKSLQTVLLHNASSKQAQEDLWALHSRKEEYAMREMEIRTRTKELKDIEMKWKNYRAIIEEDLYRANELKNMSMTESNWRTFIELCPWRTLIQCSKISFLSEMSLSDQNARISDLICLVKTFCINAKIEILDNSFEKPETIVKIPAIVEQIWLYLFPYISSRRISEIIYLADSWCHQSKFELRSREYLIPVFTDTTGCLIQHFLTHILAGKSIFSTTKNRRSVPKQAEKFYALDPASVMVLTSQDMDLEIKLIKAEKHDIPVVLTNFRPETKKRLEMHFAAMETRSHESPIEASNSIYRNFSLLVAKTLWSNSENAKAKYFLENDRRLRQQVDRPASLWRKAVDLTLAVKQKPEKQKNFFRIALSSVNNQRELRISSGKKPFSGYSDPCAEYWKPWFQVYAVSMSKLDLMAMNSNLAGSQVQFVKFDLDWQVEDLTKCFDQCKGQEFSKITKPVADTIKSYKASDNHSDSSQVLESSVLLWRRKCDLVDFCMCEMSDLFDPNDHTTRNGDNDAQFTSPHLRIGIEKMLHHLELIAKEKYEAESVDTLSPTTESAFHPHKASIIPCEKYAYELACIATTVMLCDQAIYDDKVKHFDKHLHSDRCLQTYPGFKSMRLLQELTAKNAESDLSQLIHRVLHDVSRQYSSPGQQVLFRLVWLVIQKDQKARVPLKHFFRVWAENHNRCSWIEYWNTVSLLREDHTLNLASTADRCAVQSCNEQERTVDCYSSVVSRLRRKLRHYNAFLRRLRPESGLIPPSNSGSENILHPLQEEDFVRDVNCLVARIEELWMHWIQFHKNCKEVYLPEIIQTLYMGGSVDSKHPNTFSDEVKGSGSIRSRQASQKVPNTDAHSVIQLSVGHGFRGKRRSAVISHRNEHNDFGIEPYTVYSLVRSQITLKSLYDVENTFGHIAKNEASPNNLLAKACIAMLLFPVQVPGLLLEYSNVKAKQPNGIESTTLEGNMMESDSNDKPNVAQPNNSAVEFSQLICPEWQFCSTPTFIAYEENLSDATCTTRRALEYEILLLSTRSALVRANYTSSNVTLFYLCLQTNKDECDLKHEINSISTQAMEKNQQELTRAANEAPKCNVIIFEILETKHFGFLCAMVSSVVNQHSLLEFPEWYILCPKHVARVLASINMLTHLKIHQLPMNSQFPLSELLSNICPRKSMKPPDMNLYEWVQSEHGILPPVALAENVGTRGGCESRLIHGCLNTQLQQLLAFHRHMTENGKSNTPMYQIISAQEWEYLNNSLTKCNKVIDPTGEASFAYNEFIDTFSILVRNMNWLRKEDEHHGSDGSDVRIISETERHQESIDDFQHCIYESPQSNAPKVFREFESLLQNLNKVYCDSLKIISQLDQKLSNVWYAWISPELELRIGSKFVGSILGQVKEISPSDEPCDTKHHLDFLSICRGSIPPSIILNSALLASGNDPACEIYKSWATWIREDKLQSISMPQLLMLLLGRLRTSIDLVLCSPNSFNINLALLWNVPDFFIKWKEHYNEHKEKLAYTLGPQHKISGIGASEMLLCFELEILTQESGDAVDTLVEKTVNHLESAKSERSAQCESCVLSGLTLIQERVHLIAGKKIVFYPLGNTRLHIKEHEDGIQLHHTCVSMRLIPSLSPFQNPPLAEFPNSLPCVWVPTELLDAIEAAFSGDEEEHTHIGQSTYEAHKARKSIENIRRKQSTRRNSLIIPKKFATAFSIGIPILPSEFT